MTLRYPLVLFLLVMLPTLALVWRWRGMRVSRAVLAVRLLLVTLLVLALANPVLGQAAPTPGTLVILLDQSDSLGDAGKAELRAQAEAFARNQGETAHILPFGLAPQADASAPLRADGTDIAAALHAARGLLGSSGRVVLLSDGVQTRGDALAAARAQGVPIDTFAYTPSTPPELWVAAVEAPPTLRVGEEFAVTVVVGSNQAATAQLELFAGARQLATQNITLQPGDNRFTYHDRASTAGVARFQAMVNGQPDTFAQNNRGAATALVAPPPQVLLLEGASGGGAQLKSALRQAGIVADILPAERLPTRLSALDAYEGILLLDVPAGELSLDQMANLREFVRSEGRGLVVAGGRASFTLGAYQGTPLEEALPVSMEPPPRPERPPVTLLLIVDHSLSMGSSSEISKLDMAKESALLATDALRPDDRIGVLAFDDTQYWAVDFQVIGTGLRLGQVQEQIGAITLGGGTDICAALDLGLNTLAQQPGKVRHAVIMTDGQSFRNNRCGPYPALVERARAADITLSSIAIGADADTELLQNLAHWGAGRYHFAAQPGDIPRLTLIESQIATAEPQIEGEFRAQLQAPHPLLRDFAPNQIPKLEGYVGTMLKPNAELVLKSPDNDPVLATWQYGLGRAVAWTPSATAPWAADWPNWPEYGRFWAQLVRYTLPEPDSGLLQVRATPHGDAITISADALAPSGEPIDLADTSAAITLPDSSARRIALRQTAPGHYEEQVTLPLEGPYGIAVTQQKDGSTHAAAVGYVLPPAAEYTPSGGGPGLLASISAATGGQVLPANASNTAPAVTGSAPAPRELWPWLLALAALLWPAEIAMRRGWLRLGAG